MRAQGKMVRGCLTRVLCMQRLADEERALRGRGKSQCKGSVAGT